MKNRYVKILLTVAACSSFMISAEEKVKSINTTIDSFSIDKQKEEAAAKSFIIKGNELFFSAQYLEAAKNYTSAAYIYEALKPNSAYFTEQYNKTREMIAKSYYYLAQETALKAHEQANAHDFDKAIALCKNAITIYPAAQKEMEQRIAAYEKMRAAAAKRSALSESNVMPKQNEKNYDIRIKLKQAKLLYYTGQYELARKKYQDILLEDHLCMDAVQGMKATDLALKKYGDNRLRLTHARAMAEAAWVLPDPIIKRNPMTSTNLIDEETIGKPAITEDEDIKEIKKKLETTRLSEINFDGDANNSGTPLPEALKKLRDETGINFFLYYPQANNEAAAAETPATATAPEQGLGSATADAGDEDVVNDDDNGETAESTKAAAQNRPAAATNYPLVNLNLRDKSLMEIIDALKENTKMRYKIEKNAVVFAPEDVSLDDMQIKVFMFDESMLEDFGGDASEEELKNNLKLASNKLTFPIGSKVMYDPKFRSLIVLNTPENLNLINEVLLQSRQRDPEPMVQVQVKFVEVEQSDLKELGFIQSLSRPQGDNGKTNGRLQFDTNDTVINNSGAETVTFATSRNGYNYSLVINAINQMDSKDILSSPKVLTKDGQKVKIRMVSERYFKWDYEEGDTDSDTEGGVVISAITPLWPEFEVQELGIEMEITPKVDKDKRLILLDVHPWVKALVGWSEYEYIDENGEIAPITRPIISERTTNTNVAIANEETVVIGGMIKDTTTTINDKVPLLGDIPLIGNFFKSKSTSIKKTNLLIFVTARVLKPNGMPYFPSDTLGKPSSAGIGDLY